jgi:SAM-dependent methyltransferase
MTSLGYPDGRFDAVVSVFSIFFVPDMEGLVRELWRMVRPGGKLAVTTWGPRIFEPAYSRWHAAIKRERPDLHSAFNPWDRITDIDSVRRLLRDGGVSNAEVVAEDGRCAHQMIGGPSLLDQGCGGLSTRWGRRWPRVSKQTTSIG